MRETTHTMLVPNWIWNWAQDKYETENPASKLRDLLADTVSDLRSQEQPKHSERDDTPNASDDEPDYGHIFQARRPGRCPSCGETFPAGTEVIVVRGIYKHLECYNKDVRRARREAERRDEQRPELTTERSGRTITERTTRSRNRRDNDRPRNDRPRNPRNRRDEDDDD